MNPNESRGLTYLAALWAFGSAAIGLATWICFSLGFKFATVICIFLVIIVLLSLMDSLISSLVFSVVAVGILNYFFTEPRFTLNVSAPEDIAGLVAFFVTSLAVTGLVRRVRMSSETLREQAQLLDLTHDTIIVRNEADAITFWNSAAEKLYGWNRKEAIGKIPRDLLRSEYPITLEEIRARMLRDGYWEGEMTKFRKDGTPVSVASRWSPRFDGSGRQIGTLETGNDITQRKQAEEALRRSQAAYLAEAQRLSLTGSFGWNTATGEVFWSEQSFSIYGYGADAKPSIDLMLERVHPDGASAVQRAFARASDENKEFDLEFRLLMPDGGTKQIHAVAHVMPNGGGNRQFVGAVMDVTAAKDAQERLHKAQAELAYIGRVTSLGALSSSIAHEINQPLAAIVANGEACIRWLARGAQGVGEVSTIIKTIMSDGKRASEIVQRIRGLSKRTEMKKVEINLNDVIQEVLPLVQREIVGHRAALQLELARDLPPVLADRVQLQQVIINLILNAVQAMATVTDRARTLVVRSTQAAPDSVRIAVEDSGPGIKPEDAERVFDAFFTTKPDGMGMGLSICRSIIEIHGGQIRAVSQSSGPGAIFSFNLPAISQASLQ